MSSDTEIVPDNQTSGLSKTCNQVCQATQHYILKIVCFWLMFSVLAVYLSICYVGFEEIVENVSVEMAEIFGPETATYIESFLWYTEIVYGIQHISFCPILYFSNSPTWEFWVIAAVNTLTFVCVLVEAALLVCVLFSCNFGYTQVFLACWCTAKLAFPVAADYVRIEMKGLGSKND